MDSGFPTMRKPILISVLTSVFHGNNYLEFFLHNIHSQTVFDNLELILVMNEPDLYEQNIVNSFFQANPDQVKILIVGNVESVYSSWNRAWSVASGSYVTAWNIDDYRLEDSLEKQVQKLENEPQCSLVYGDFVITKNLGDRNGVRVTTPDFNKNTFTRSFYTGGAFLVWKDLLKQKVGYFDEQLRIAGDFEYINRLLLAGEQFCKTEGIIGYFTDTQSGLSTRGELNGTMIEESFVHLRYGNYDKVKRFFLPQLEQFNVDSVYYEGSWHQLNKIIPNYENQIKSVRYRKILGRVLDPIRRIIISLGFWKQFVYWKQRIEGRLTNSDDRSK